MKSDVEVDADGAADAADDAVDEVEDVRDTVAMVFMGTIVGFFGNNTGIRGFDDIGTLGCCLISFVLTIT